MGVAHDAARQQTSEQLAALQAELDAERAHSAFVVSKTGVLEQVRGVGALDNGGDDAIPSMPLAR